jgi:hypothetical protein
VLTIFVDSRRADHAEPCARPADFPRSYQEAWFALKMQSASGSDNQATEFDQLGVYRILRTVTETASIERFVREWLGSLLDYDADKRSELVTTLSRYLECARATRQPPRRSRCTAAPSNTDCSASGRSPTAILLTPTPIINLQLATRAWRTLLALRGESL